jgi:hypothetical protein
MPAAAPNPMQGFGQMNQTNQFGGMQPNPMAQQGGFHQQGFAQQSMSPMGMPQQAQPFGNQSAFTQQQAYNPMQMGQMNNLGMLISSWPPQPFYLTPANTVTN